MARSSERSVQPRRDGVRLGPRPTSSDLGVDLLGYLGRIHYARLNIFATCSRRTGRAKPVLPNHEATIVVYEPEASV